MEKEVDVERLAKLADKIREDVKKALYGISKPFAISIAEIIDECIHREHKDEKIHS